MLGRLRVVPSKEGFVLEQRSKVGRCMPFSPAVVPHYQRYFLTAQVRRGGSPVSEKYRDWREVVRLRPPTAWSEPQQPGGSLARTGDIASCLGERMYSTWTRVLHHHLECQSVCRNLDSEPLPLVLVM